MSTPEPGADMTEEREGLQRITEAFRAVTDAEAAEALAKEALADAKAETKAARARLDRVILSESVPLPLFDRPRTETAAPSVAEVSEPAPAPASDPEPEPLKASAWGPDGDSGSDATWRRWPLSKLGLKPRTLSNLEDADLFTVGQLAQWSEAGRPLTDLGGIGEAKASEIDDALTRFWSDRPDRAGADAAAASPAEVAPDSFEPPTDWTPETDARDREDEDD